MMVTARVADLGLSSTVPLGKAPISAPQAKKILGPKRRFTAKLSDFEWGTHDRQVQYRGVLTPVLGTIDAIPNPTCTGLLVGVINYEFTHFTAASWPQNSPSKPPNFAQSRYRLNQTDRRTYRSAEAVCGSASADPARQRNCPPRSGGLW